MIYSAIYIIGITMMFSLIFYVGYRLGILMGALKEQDRVVAYINRNPSRTMYTMWRELYLFHKHSHPEPEEEES